MSNETTSASGYAASPYSETDGSLQSRPRKERPLQTSLDMRLARIESRLVQLMIHMGLNPYEKTYDANKSNPQPTPSKRVPDRW